MNKFDYIFFDSLNKIEYIGIPPIPLFIDVIYKKVISQ
jgi:hypothetical protein